MIYIESSSSKNVFLDPPFIPASEHQPISLNRKSSNISK